MTPSKLRCEQEVTCTFNNEDDHAIVWCGSPAHIRRLQKITKANWIEPVRVDSQGICWHLPKSWIQIKPKGKKNLSDEQRKVMADRMRGLKRS